MQFRLEKVAGGEWNPREQGFGLNGVFSAPSMPREDAQEVTDTCHF